MFKELLVKDGYEYDYAFDWVIMNDKLVNQNVLTMVDNGEDQESKQSSMIHNDGDKDHNEDGMGNKSQIEEEKSDSDEDNEDKAEDSKRKKTDGEEVKNSDDEDNDTENEKKKQEE